MGRLVGHIFVHKGDDSGFVAERVTSSKPVFDLPHCDFIRAWSNRPLLVRADMGRLSTEADVTAGALAD